MSEIKSKSAYSCFSEDCKILVKAEFPQLKYKETMKEVASRWKKLKETNPETVKDYKEKAKLTKKPIATQIPLDIKIPDVEIPLSVKVPEVEIKPKPIEIKPFYKPDEKMVGIQREYVQLSNPIFDQISTLVRKSYKNACILFVEKVHNEFLQKKHEELYENIKDKRGYCNRMELFHGTNAVAIDSIINSGLLVGYNKCAAYGKGSYFARNASYSFNYMHPVTGDEVTYMFLCDVLVGNYKTYGSNQQIDTVNYDNSVDNMKTPTIVVTPHDYGSLPIYIIAFHKFAK